uniref:Mannitol 1-phosphate dehydrogenase n=1 Tax=Mycena chlorophos TaxID=658473 RepID=A0ABQ0LQZ6_MYCCL|nr:mannitol 1-phosphate dehydrogenase [Mycena chlorophos]
MATQVPSIAIVGGGIAGLTLALNLIKLSTTNTSAPRFTVTIYESAHHFAEIGAGVSFGPNASHAMRCISPEVYAAFERTETTNQSPEKKDVWFDFRFGETVDGRFSDEGLGEFICSVKCKNGQRGVKRSDFLDELIKVVPDGISHFGKRVTHYTSGSDGVTLHFKDGATARHDVVLGCDGIKSSIRKTLLATNPAEPFFSGKFCYRGLVPMDEAIAALGEEAAMNAQLYLGRGGHVLTLSIDHGRVMNVVVFNSAKEWTNPEWVVAANHKQMQDEFASWSPTVNKIISMMRNNDIWALFNDPPASTFVSEDGRVALVGDAAHATTPHKGSGAGMAIEDAYILGNLISEALTLNPDAAKSIPAALRTYNDTRRERGLHLVEDSRETGRLYDLEHPDFGFDKEKIKESLLKRMDWVWEHDVQVELAAAVEKLKAGLQ